MRQNDNTLHTMKLPHSSQNGPEVAATPPLDAAIAHALAQPPLPEIPTGFAAQVAQRAAAQTRPGRLAWPGWGPRLAFGSSGILTAALFALAPHAVPRFTSLSFDAELILLAELGTLLLLMPRLLRE